jgi:hypothetical protein
MENNELTGIERQLVLQYLMDANVPVTLIENDKTEKDAKETKDTKDVKIKKLASGVFPVALPGEQLTVLDQGIILLQNPPESVKAFNGKEVRVQFYFNRLGLYFITTVKTVKSGLALVIPSVIKKIEEKKSVKKEIFTALLYYSKKSENASLKCGFIDDCPPFSVPVWSEVEEDNQVTAKNYLERFVMQCRSDGKSIGNGLYLIRVVKFLAEKNKTDAQAIEGRKNPPSVLYVDEQRIVFASSKEELVFDEGANYSVLLSFPILQGPIKERTVYIDIRVENIFEDDDKSKCCTVCSFTKIKEEDARYLEDKKCTA